MLNKFLNYFSYYQWWKNLDKFILGLIITFFLIGLFFSLVSTSLVASDKLETNSYFFFFKHLIFVSIGLLLIFIFSYIDQSTLYKSSIYIFCFAFLLLLLVPSSLSQLLYSVSLASHPKVSPCKSSFSNFDWLDQFHLGCDKQYGSQRNVQ